MERGRIIVRYHTVSGRIPVPAAFSVTTTVTFIAAGPTRPGGGGQLQSYTKKNITVTAKL